MFELVLKKTWKLLNVWDVSALYYREKETGDSTRPAQQVVAIEDLWDTLVGVHNQLSNGGRQRMERYLIEHGTHLPRPVIQLFLDLCQTCQETRGRKSTHKIIHKPINPDTVGQQGQADLVDLQMIPDGGYKYISSTTKIGSASLSSCESSRPRQLLRWQTAW